MKQKIISIEESIGLPLSHDLTMIDQASGYKGARFKRGHIVTHEDISVLRSMGRENLSILQLEPDEVHEDDAALRIADKIKSSSFNITSPSEGRCNLVAAKNGLFVFDEAAIHKINLDDDWVFSTIPNYSVIKKGDIIAAWRIAPLVMTEERVARAENLVPNFDIAEFKPLPAALITTGIEIFEGKKTDAFAQKLRQKLVKYNAEILSHIILPDDADKISEEIKKQCEGGAKIVFCTGGMSVDADDLTPAAIKNVCDEIIFKGIPTLPGSNLMLGRRGDAYIFGVPACAVHAQVTVLDKIMNRIYAGIPPTHAEIRTWGVGGLCRACANCNFPVCSFG